VKNHLNTLSSNFYRMLVNSFGFYVVAVEGSVFLCVGEFRKSFRAGENFDSGDIFMFLVD